VTENDGGWHEVREELLSGVRNMIMNAAKKKGWRLSRIGLLSNHLHILLGAAVTESPQSVALSLMNNIAYVSGMTPVLKFSYCCSCQLSLPTGINPAESDWPRYLDTSFFAPGLPPGSPWAVENWGLRLFFDHTRIVAQGFAWHQQLRYRTTTNQ